MRHRVAMGSSSTGVVGTSSFFTDTLHSKAQQHASHMCGKDSRLQVWSLSHVFCITVDSILIGNIVLYPELLKNKCYIKQHHKNVSTTSQDLSRV